MQARLFSAGVLAIVLSSSAAWADHDPRGESAKYLIDTDDARTDSMVEGGQFLTSIGGQAGGPKVETYQVTVDFDLRLRFMGRKTGKKDAKMAADFFSGAWIKDLRQNGHYESKQFKAEHLGYEDVELKDGHSYAHCDHVRLYDIDENLPSILDPLATVGAQLLAPTLDGQGLTAPKVEDMEMIVDLHEGIPAIGAVRLDVSGKVSGMAVKAGADYVQP